MTSSFLSLGRSPGSGSNHEDKHAKYGISNVGLRNSSFVDRYSSVQASKIPIAPHAVTPLLGASSLKASGSGGSLREGAKSNENIKVRRFGRRTLMGFKISFSNPQSPTSAHRKKEKSYLDDNRGLCCMFMTPAYNEKHVLKRAHRRSCRA